MSVIEELLKKSEQELEKNNSNSYAVGNRPHYPMFMLFNRQFDRVQADLLFSRIRKIWSQSVKHLVCFSYSPAGDGGLSFGSVCEGSEYTSDEVFAQIDSAKKASGIFAEMNLWNVYNIIDTSVIKTEEEFVRHYGLCADIDKIVLDPHKTMAVILLDDSTAKRSTANSIRDYIANNPKYDSTVIISNRSRSNSMCEMEELYRIVTNVLILSNNDAVSSADDQVFVNLSSTLFSGVPFTVSYVLRERPNEKITKQILDVMFGELLEEIDGKSADFSSLQKKLGFDNTSRLESEVYLKSINLDIDSSVLRLLPFKDSSVMAKTDFSKARYKDVEPLLCDGAFSAFLARFCDSKVGKGISIDRYVEMFRKKVVEQLDSAELAVYGGDTAERLFDQIQADVVSKDLAAAAYFSAKARSYVRNELLYPRFKETFADLRNRAVERVGQIKSSYEELKDCIPLSFDDVGTIYKNRCSNFLRSAQGEKCKKSILDPTADLLDRLVACFREILDANTDLFRLSFINAWALQLGLAGDQIYGMISKAITDDADNAIRLHGNYPIDTRLKVLMLHTHDGNGGHPTELYEHLQKTFGDDSTVQFFNTGYDDSLEALYFIACPGSNLLY